MTNPQPTTPRAAEEIRYYLVQLGETASDKNVLHSFENPIERDSKTILLIFGEEITTQDQAEQWDKMRDELTSKGHISFEGDPGLEWFTAIPDAPLLQPAAEAAANLDQAVADITNTFLRWKLPESVCADLCVTRQGKGRTGTNLLTLPETLKMVNEVVRPIILRHMGHLAPAAHSPELVAREIEPDSEFEARFSSQTEINIYLWGFRDAKTKALRRLAPGQGGGAATVEDAAKFLEKKSRAHWEENGRHEPDTGAPGPEAVVEYCDMLDELAEEIRKLPAHAAPPPQNEGGPAKITIAELEAMIKSGEELEIEIKPDGSIHAVKKGTAQNATPKVLTLKDALGGEYASPSLRDTVERVLKEHLDSGAFIHHGKQLTDRLCTALAVQPQGAGSEAIRGILTRAGTFLVRDEEVTGFLVTCSREDIEAVKRLPMLRRVVITEEGATPAPLDLYRQGITPGWQRDCSPRGAPDL